MKVTKGDKILEISKEYLLLFNALTDAEAALTRLRTELLLAQQPARRPPLPRRAKRGAPFPLRVYPSAYIPKAGRQAGFFHAGNGGEAGEGKTHIMKNNTRYRGRL